ncbi:MAG: hypothetical protein WAV90_07015 [Gordonia amarae]
MTGIIVEIQRRPDNEKRFSWPHYCAALGSRLRCVVHLLVLCPDEKTARWASGPFETGYGSFIPVVLGPSRIPPVTDMEEARADPDLAMLSAMTHPRNWAVLRALPAVFDPDIPNHRMYAAITQTIFPAHVLSQLEVVLKTQAHAWVAETDWGRELIEKLKADAQKEGLQKGLRKGIEQGIAQGHDRELVNQARTLLTVLETKGITVDEAARRQINACADTDQLSAWTIRAVTASSIEEILS